MRAQAIKTLTERTGDADMAAAVWEMFVKHAFAGREPSEAMFKMLDKDESLAAMPVGFRKPLAALWPDAPPEPAKGRKFKVEKARQYTHEEIAAFVAADPKGATEGLAAETLRRTGGQPFRLIVDGKLDIAETAKRIDALKERDPVAPFVIIGGKEITPVGFEIDAAKEDAEDPYLRGEPLGQPGDVSNYLGMSLAKVSHETRQAIDCAMQHDLADASLRERQNSARDAEGKTPDEWLVDYPIARRAWPTWKKRPLKVARRPFVEPPAPTKAQRGGDVTRPNGWIPTIYVHGVDHNEADWTKLDNQLNVAVAAKQVRFCHRKMVGAGGEVEKRLSDMRQSADGMIVLVSADTFAAANRREFDVAVKDFARPIVPVILRSCIWRAVRDLEALGPIPSSGKSIATTGEWTEAAMDILAFAQTLQPRVALDA